VWTLLDKQSVSIASAVGTFAIDSPNWATAKLQNQQRQDHCQPFGMGHRRVWEVGDFKVTFVLNRSTFGLCGIS
jgi:hypothetical protein